MDIQRHKIVWTDEKVSRLWNYYATTIPYSEIFFSKLFGSKLIVKSGLPLDEELSVLDFGCGPGYIWEHLLTVDAKWNYTGIDFSADGVSQLLYKAGTHSQFRGAHHITSMPTPFPPQSFDVILLFEVLEHLNDRYLAGTMEEVSRLLKVGGVAVISTPNEERLSDSEKFCPECGAIFHEWQHVRSWELGSLTDYVEKYGFRRMSYQRLNFTTTSMIHKFIRIVKIMLNKKINEPHLIVSFQKTSVNSQPS